MFSRGAGGAVGRAASGQAMVAVVVVVWMWHGLSSPSSLSSMSLSSLSVSSSPGRRARPAAAWQPNVAARRAASLAEALVRSVCRPRCGGTTCRRGVEV